MKDFGVYPEDKNQYVHIMGIACGGDFTACGMASDICSHQSGLGELVLVSSRTVTCPECIEVIKHYRGVHTKEQA